MMQKVLVLGASLKKVRYSNSAVKLLLEYKHEVFAIGNTEGNINGAEVLRTPPTIPGLDTVTLYLNPTNQEAYYDYILEAKPKRVIFNPGSENPVLTELLDEAGIFYEEACTLVLLRADQFALTASF